MFKILNEVEIYKRFIRVWQRDVLFPDGRQISWFVFWLRDLGCDLGRDVAGHNVPNPAFAVIFPYDSKRVSYILH